MKKKFNFFICQVGENGTAQNWLFSLWLCLITKPFSCLLRQTISRVLKETSCESPSNINLAPTWTICWLLTAFSNVDILQKRLFQSIYPHGDLWRDDNFKYLSNFTGQNKKMEKSFKKCSYHLWITDWMIIYDWLLVNQNYWFKMSELCPKNVICVLLAKG